MSKELTPVERLNEINLNDLTFKDFQISSYDESLPYVRLRGPNAMRQLEAKDRELIEKYIVIPRWQYYAARWRLRGLDIDRAILKGLVAQTMSEFWRTESSRPWLDTPKDEESKVIVEELPPPPEDDFWASCQKRRHLHLVRYVPEPEPEQEIDPELIKAIEESV